MDIADRDERANATPHLVIDATGLECVQLILRLRAESIQLPSGTLVEVVSTDPVSVFDLPAWCHLIGHTHLGSKQVDGTYVHTIELSDTPALTRADAPWHS